MAFLLYLAIGVGIPWHFDETARDAGLFIPDCLPGLRPEPRERFLFLLGLACIPTLPMACFWLLTRIGRALASH